MVGALSLGAVEARAQLSVDAGVNMGSISIAGNAARVAVVPSLGLRYRREDWIFSLRDECMIFGAFGPSSAGVNNLLTLAAGRAGHEISGQLGASLAAYWFQDLIGPTRRGQAFGLAPGANFHLDWYWRRISIFDVGAQLDVNASYFGGASLVVPKGFVVMGMIGPSFEIARKGGYEKNAHSFE